MKVLSVSNFKGGVGKTSICSNFAAYLANKGKRVLCVDLDAQGNLSQLFSADLEESEGGIFDLLTGSMEFDQVAKSVAVDRGKIDILPSSVSLALADAKLMFDYGQKGAIERLKVALQPIRREYDFCLCDCSPSIGIITQNAFKISDFVLIPLLCEYLAVRGIETMKEAVSLFREQGVNNKLEIGGLILSRYDSRATLYREIRKGLERSYDGLLFSQAVRVSVAISEAQAARVSVFEHDSESRGASDMMALFDEICTKLKLL